MTPSNNNTEKTKLSRRVWSAVILFGFMGQLAWAIENMYFNLFLFNYIGGTTGDIATMVMASAVVATIATLIMGALSDKLGRRKIFICCGYIIWGIITLCFAFLSRENIAALMPNADASKILLATVGIVIGMDCLMTFFGSTGNDAAFNTWITDVTDTTNRGTVEGVLSALPLLATLVVSALSGIIIDAVGYPIFFILLGSLVLICGIIGLFLIKESGTKTISKENYFANIFYGFRPSVIKKNAMLYIILIAMLFYSIAFNVFMPYFIIYLQHYLGLTVMQYSLVLGIVILLSAGLGIYLGTLTDKIGRSPLIFISIGIYVVGLVALTFITNIIALAILGTVMLTGSMLLLIIFNSAIRDHTPADKVGLFQGIRMIFCVLLPMSTGPAIGNAIISQGNKFFTNEYGELVNVPTPYIFLGAAIVALFIIIPAVFIYRDERKKKLQKLAQISMPECTPKASEEQSDTNKDPN